MQTIRRNHLGINRLKKILMDVRVGLNFLQQFLFQNITSNCPYSVTDPGFIYRSPVRNRILCSYSSIFIKGHGLNCPRNQFVISSAENVFIIKIKQFIQVGQGYSTI